MSSVVGELPSGVGELVSHPTLPFIRPLTPEEQAKQQAEHKSQWEEQEEKRQQTRQRLERELQEAEAKAAKSALRLPAVELHLKTLLACRGEEARRQLQDPVGYGREIGYTKSDIQALEIALRAPEKIRTRLAHMDNELVGDELHLVSAWNMAGESARRLLLKLLGVEFVNTAEVHGQGVDLTRSLPTSKG